MGDTPLPEIAPPKAALSAPVFRHARFVAQSEWRLAPSATSRLSIRCWTSSRSSTVSELMSSLRRRPQINRALHWPNHLHATLRATFHRRRVRPTRATTTGRRTACSSWLARSRASTGADLRDVVETTRYVLTQDIINSTELRAASSTSFENGPCDGRHFTMKQQATVAPAFKPVVPCADRRWRWLRCHRLRLEARSLTCPAGWTRRSGGAAG